MNSSIEDKDNTLEKRIQNASLTRGQHRIADYFLKNQRRICNMTSLSIAREIGVSDASVIRFSRAIGYDGFAELKESLYSHLTQELTSINVGNFAPDERLHFQNNEFKSLDFSSEFLKLMNHNIEQSICQNSSYLYDRAIDIIVKSSRKIIIGIRGSRGCAMQFSRLLGFLLDRVELLATGEGDELSSLRGVSKEDVILTISYARYYRTDAELAELIRKTGASIIVLTDSTKSPLAQVADLLFLVETKHLGFSNSTQGTSCLLEYLLTLLCWKYPEECQERLKEREQIVASLLLEHQ